MKNKQTRFLSSKDLSYSWKSGDWDQLSKKTTWIHTYMLDQREYRRDLSAVISDEKMSKKLKVKLYMTVIRPVLLYGAEYWTVGKKEEHILEKTEMRVLRGIKGVTLRDKVKSVDIRKELGVNSIKEKVREMKLHWYGHMQWMEEHNEVRAVVDMRVPGKVTKRETKREMDGLCLKG